MGRVRPSAALTLIRLPLPELDRSPIRLAETTRPILLAVVDTEEEFDWGAAFDPRATSVGAMRSVGRGQEVFDEFGVKPCYVVDHPVADSEAACSDLAHFLADARASLGAHLHPWVTPPVEEEISRHNSFAGNLPADLEAAKIDLLCERIERSLGERPRVYKAGRYGFGPNTAEILESRGFDVDLSFSPPFDYSAEGGPDYSGVSCDPFWFGRGRRLLGVPSTGAYVGFCRIGAHRLYSLADGPVGRGLRAAGVLARLRAVERIHLSPEGYRSAELRRLTRALLRRGARVFALAFHSPSLEPGHTPYVRTSDELEAFLGRLRGYLEFFLRDLDGVAMTPLELKRFLEVPPSDRRGERAGSAHDARRPFRR